MFDKLSDYENTAVWNGGGSRISQKLEEEEFMFKDFSWEPGTETVYW